MMRLLPFLLIVFFSCSKKERPINAVKPLLQTEQIQLAPPHVLIDSLLFKESATAMIRFDMEGAKIIYSLNDEEQKIYTEPLSINQTTILKVHSTKVGFIKSEVQQFHFIKVTNLPSTTKINLSPQPSEQYAGNGATSLFDCKKGKVNFKGDNSWLGFQDNLVELSITFSDSIAIDKVYVSLLSDHNSWVFHPKVMEARINATRAAIRQFQIPKVAEKAKSNVVEIDLLGLTKCKELKISIRNFDKIPDWHPGAGSSPWLFIDEIIIE